MAEEQVIINKTEKPNSISFHLGGTGTDVKIYFKDQNDLNEQLEEMNIKMPFINKNVTEIRSKWSNG